MYRSTNNNRVAWVILFFVLFWQGSVYGQSATHKTASDSYKKEYHFSEDFFTHNILKWEKFLSPYKNQENLQYLEIGVFEGGSAVWMLENILTQPDARLTGIDIFNETIEKRFWDNVTLSGYSEKVKIIKGFSQKELRALPVESFDIIYIDGSHTAKDVLIDLVLSWGLLKNHGILILDDYKWKRPDLPEELKPQLAIDSFLTMYRNHFNLLFKGYQIILRKNEQSVDGHFPIGPYVYRWGRKDLRVFDTKEKVPITHEEKDIIERIIRSRQFGDVSFPKDVLAQEDVHLLLQKLNIHF